MKEFLESIQPWQVYLFCLAFYFFWEFKTRSEKGTGFSLKYWLADNKWNAGLILFSTILYFILHPDLTNTEAAIWGLSPNLVIDWIQTFRYQQKLRQ